MKQEFVSKDEIKECLVIDYPKGTRVAVWCHSEDKDIVTKDVKRKGYILAYTQEADGYLKYLIKRGTYLMMKEPEQNVAWLDNITCRITCRPIL